MRGWSGGASRFSGVSWSSNLGEQVEKQFTELAVVLFD